ncbi:MAG: hypothetical protein GF411_03115 [Candidatus Lokiarchaeota archaeon]|nr:hypothetical protein [Candidatus Lokiarchaeota archaeon]
MTEYEFNSHEEVLRKVADYLDMPKSVSYDIKKKEKDDIIDAVTRFVQRRKTSELIDFFSITIDNISIWDTGELYKDIVDKEFAKRYVPQPTEIYDLLSNLHPDWLAKKDTLEYKFSEIEKRINGIQKKVDKIVKLLDNFEITMSVGDALKV